MKGGNDIQYSDGSTYNIVTLNIFRPSQLGISETEYASIDPIYVANSVLSGQKTLQHSKRFGVLNQKLANMTLMLLIL